jgi:hypothetical protein
LILILRYCQWAGFVSQILLFLWRVKSGLKGISMFGLSMAPRAGIGDFSSCPMILSLCQRYLGALAIIFRPWRQRLDVGEQ